MAKYLLDPANAITAAALGLGVLGIYLGLTGRPELGIAAALGAFLADHVDGVVAKRTAGRSQHTREIGRNLDSLADLVCECLFPGLILLVVNDYALSSLAIATASIIVGALRLSYYNTFGARDGYFVGVPVTYVVPALATVFLLSPLLGPGRLGLALNITFCILLLLHLSSIRIPVTKGWMYAPVVIFALGASAALIGRGMS
ncbi:MAG: CDP-alcohol phosphatidyltransferase family protein [Bradyrhizobium sp.]|uniref:CDP-alcohol phosphatidyltransferase family protein n=1 Tax=Bradyrhizobium sp. TaxID=376 RepID=UPI001D4A4A3D|nr:CDP-alcohol phosphatidyltransferase family protein [Bradyrhizobium sp.]MBV9563484.1 CDP-alcohol phosphatidyltransferase family protein [Bradyrhizobium sp.]